MADRQTVQPSCCGVEFSMSAPFCFTLYVTDVMLLFGNEESSGKERGRFRLRESRCKSTVREITDVRCIES